MVKLPAAPCLTVLLGGCLLLGGCGASIRPDSGTIPPELQRQARPIGRGPGFHLPASGAVHGACLSRLGARGGVHVEMFAQNKVVLLPAGIGTRPPRRYSSGRISAARCYGDLVTLEPTGVVLVRRGTRLSLATLFSSWGQRLSARRVSAFPAPAGARVSVYVDGRRWRGPPGAVPLRRHAELVIEVGPHVPPHTSYTFPPGT